VSLSICCATAEPGRAAVALGALRGAAEEIVVAVDVSGGEPDLTPLGGVADRVLEIELGSFVESALAWLHGQCVGEWVLRIDDDELPDGRLLEALPELTRAGDVTQYWLARRWLYPDGGSWLEENPWFPDFQGRLVRNDARLWFPGLCHTSVTPARPARYLECGLYHFAHLLGDRGEREREVERLLAVDARLRESGSDRYLPDCYVPERRPGARRAEVDARDRAAVAGALRRLRGRGGDDPRGLATTGKGWGIGEGENRNGGRAPWARRVPMSEVHASWAAREIPDSAYRARIEPVDLYRSLVRDDCRPFRVRVHNDGEAHWPGGEDRRPLIRVAYRWLTPDGGLFEAEGVRTALPRPLAPGESGVVAMSVVAPATPGRYVLAPDLVHEHIRWFGCESEPVEMLVTGPQVIGPQLITGEPAAGPMEPVAVAGPGGGAQEDRANAGAATAAGAGGGAPAETALA
jgi:hypothetical protein